MFYDKFKFLCDTTGISCNKAALAMGLSNATPTKWKKTGAVPEGSTLSKVAAFFEVPVNFFLDTPPFDAWDNINQNRKTFLQSFQKIAGLNSEMLDITWGFDLKNPDAIPVKDLMAFLSEAVDSARLGETGTWDIKPRAAYQKEKASDLTEKERRDVAKEVVKIMDSLEESGDLMFDGVPMSDEARASMAAAMRIGLEEARRRNKETYTPKKYLKG